MSFLVWKSINIEPSFFPNYTLFSRDQDFLSSTWFLFYFSGFSATHQQKSPYPFPMVLSVTVVWWPWNVAFAGKRSDGIWGDATRASWAQLPPWKEGRVSHLYLKAADATSAHHSSTWLYPQRSIHGQHPTARQLWKSWGARGTSLALPQHAKTAQLQSVSFTIICPSGWKYRAKHPGWCTQVLRRTPHSKCLCRMQLTHLFT